MKELVEDNLLGWDTVKKVLYARFDREGSVSLGDRYRVPRQYIPGGVAEVTNIDAMSITCTSGVQTMWFVDLKAVTEEPDNPCDVDYMEEISS